MIDTDVIESTPRAYIGKTQGKTYGWILRNFRLHKCAPNGTPFGIT